MHNLAFQYRTQNTILQNHKKNVQWMLKVCAVKLHSCQSNVLKLHWTWNIIFLFEWTDVNRLICLTDSLFNHPNCILYLRWMKSFFFCCYFFHVFDELFSHSKYLEKNRKLLTITNNISAKTVNTTFADQLFCCP